MLAAQAGLSYPTRIPFSGFEFREYLCSACPARLPAVGTRPGKEREEGADPVRHTFVAKQKRLLGKSLTSARFSVLTIMGAGATGLGAESPVCLQEPTWWLGFLPFGVVALKGAPFRAQRTSILDTSARIAWNLASPTPQVRRLAPKSAIWLKVLAF